MIHLNNDNTNSYDDGNIPEIDLPKSSNAIPSIPPEFGSQSSISKEEDERPRKDGPGGD